MPLFRFDCKIRFIYLPRPSPRGLEKFPRLNGGGPPKSPGSGREEERHGLKSPTFPLAYRQPSQLFVSGCKCRGIALYSYGIARGLHPPSSEMNKAILTEYVEACQAIFLIFFLLYGCYSLQPGGFGTSATARQCYTCLTNSEKPPLIVLVSIFCLFAEPFP